MAATERSVEEIAGQKMRTFTDRLFDPLDMTVDDVDIADIAHALALSCRYGGHSHGHLSVARHSLWVCADVELHEPWDWQLLMTALLHDASEAYIGDMIRPLKHRPEMAMFREVEARIEATIAERYSLIYPYPQIIHDADLQSCYDRERTGRFEWQGEWQWDERAFLNKFNFLAECRG